MSYLENSYCVWQLGIYSLWTSDLPSPCWRSSTCPYLLLASWRLQHSLLLFLSINNFLSSLKYQIHDFKKLIQFMIFSGSVHWATKAKPVVDIFYLLKNWANKPTFDVQHWPCSKSSYLSAAAKSILEVSRINSPCFPPKIQVSLRGPGMAVMVISIVDLSH